MKVTKTFEITFDEPSPHWLCADNLAVCLVSKCSGTDFTVREVSCDPPWDDDYPVSHPSHPFKETSGMETNDKLNASEALYGFCAWLTTRKEVTTASSSHDSAPIAERLKQFCETNKLPDVRDDYVERFEHPDK